MEDSTQEQPIPSEVLQQSEGSGGQVGGGGQSLLPDDFLSAGRYTDPSPGPAGVGCHHHPA